MKLSKMHIKTLREVPAEAEIPSHILLLRTGMIRKLASGIYGFMPFGWRSVKKIEDIIRQEMDAAGGQEIHMSAIQPAELWQGAGRWCSAYMAGANRPGCSRTGALEGKGQKRKGLLSWAYPRRDIHRYNQKRCVLIQAAPNESVSDPD